MKVTISDVARLAGVSTATVSHTINNTRYVSNETKEKVYQAIRGGLAGSTVMDAKVPMMLDRNFTPGGTIKVNHKDIKNVMATAHDVDVPLPLTSQLFEIMQALKVGGHMGDDHSGIVQYFEQLADVKVQRPER